jgi:hypothetical protein
LSTGTGSSQRDTSRRKCDQDLLPVRIISDICSYFYDSKVKSDRLPSLILTISILWQACPWSFRAPALRASIRSLQYGQTLWALQSFHCEASCSGNCTYILRHFL